jgi:rubrerythrin
MPSFPTVNADVNFDLSWPQEQKKVYQRPEMPSADLIATLAQQMEDHRDDFHFFSNLLKEFMKTTTKAKIIQTLQLIIAHEQSHFATLRQILWELTGTWAEDLDTSYVPQRMEGSLSDALVTGFEGEMEDAQKLQAIFSLLGNVSQKDRVLTILLEEQENAIRLVYTYSWWNCGKQVVVPEPRPAA